MTNLDYCHENYIGLLIFKPQRFMDVKIKYFFYNVLNSNNIAIITLKSFDVAFFKQLYFAKNHYL